jgi:SAM-dependent methyltransferase
MNGDNLYAKVAKINFAFHGSRTLHAATSLRVFDFVAYEGSSAEEVSKQARADTRAMGILLDALVALRLLRKKKDRYFHSKVSRVYLRSDSPEYFGHMILFEDLLWNDWGRLAQCIKGGNPVRSPDRFQRTEADTERFIMAMHSIVSARGDAKDLAGRIDLKGFRGLLDLGGGPGTYAMEFARANRHLDVGIFDLPGTLRVTRRLLAQHGMQERIRLHEGDYNLDPFPSGYDVVLLSNIIHGENEETNEALMAKIYRAVGPKGSVVIKDHLLDRSGTAPPDGALFSVNLLLFTNGRCYRSDEVSSWVERAGFDRVFEEKLPPPMNSSLILAGQVTVRSL